MSWTLGGVTLPDPQGFGREQIESSTYHEAINGHSSKDITNRKERYKLKYEKRTQAEVALILALYSQFEILDFEVADGSLNISSTPVHVEITDRAYGTKGSEYREDFTLVLTEVE